MTRTHKRKKGARRYADYTAANLKKALLNIKNKILSQREAAKVFNIPRSTLKNKLKKAHMKHYGRPSAFTEQEETAFVSHLIKMSQYGFPVDKLDLRMIVKNYLAKQERIVPWFKNNLPGDEWVISFLARHKDLSVRLSNNIKRKRAEVGEREIKVYFSNLKVELENMKPQNIWNFDETNLSDDPGSKKIITKRGLKYPERIINTTKTCISLMFCGSAAGELLPPYTVYKADSMWNTWTLDGPSGARYNRSKSGWFDTCCFDDWFGSMVLPKLKKLAGAKALIGDNLSSHISERVITLCEKNNIKFIALPPNSTHLTQPLDIALFRPMKVAWRKVLTNWKIRCSGKNNAALPKNEFPHLLKLLLQKIKSSEEANLQSGFRKAGIYPLCAKEVLNRLPTSDMNDVTDTDDDAEVTVPRKTGPVVSQSFLDYLKEMRSPQEQVVQRKKKVKVMAGKSVTSEEVKALEEVQSSKTKKKRNDRNVSDKENIPIGIPSTSSKTKSEKPRLQSKTRCTDTAACVDTLALAPATVITPEAAEQLAKCQSGESGSDQTAEAANILSVLQVGEWVSVEYNSLLYPGEVKVLHNEGAEISVMHPKGPERISWYWPTPTDLIYYKASDIKKKIVAPWRTYDRGNFVVDSL